MAKLRFNSGFFEEDIKEVDFDSKKSLKEQIENYVNDNIYKQNLVECYDSETGSTFYATLEEDSENPSVIITVNNTIVDLSYEVKDDDIINIAYIPSAWDWWSSLWGSLVGSFAGALYGATLGAGVFSWAGFAIGAIAGGIIGFFGGGLIGGWIKDLMKGMDYELGQEGSKRLDIRGAENQSILNNPYPFVIGKQLITPYIVGDPVTEYSGEYGEDAYIKVLYCAGYSPLKLTDFKLGEQILSYNRSTNIDRRTLLSGLLTGTSESGSLPDSGDILDVWSNNEIKLELIQNNARTDISYGRIYSEEHEDQNLDTNVLFVADKTIEEAASIVYKGLSFPNNYRTNSVFFTAAYPKKFKITLDFPNGLYSTHTEVDDEISKTKYDKIPTWVAVQWRIYDSANPTSRSDGTDYNLWNNITEFNNKDFGEIYTQSEFERDINAHKGNTLSTTVKDMFVSTPVSPEDIISTFLSLPSASRDTDCTSALKCYKVEGKYEPAIIPHVLWASFYFDNEVDKHLFSAFNSNNRYLGYLTQGNSDSGRCVYDPDNKILYFDYNKDLENTVITEGSKYLKRTPSSTNTINITELETPINVTLYNYISYEDLQEGSYRQGTGVGINLEVKEIGICGNYTLEEVESIPVISGNWINKRICNFEKLFDSSENPPQAISEMRLTAEVDLSSYVNDIIKDANTTKSVEVRVVRVSPSYLNQTSSNSKEVGAYSYCDIIKVLSLVTVTFDIDYYKNHYTVVSKKPFNENDARKFCYIAISAKADAAGRIKQQLKKFNCIAESFSPYWDEENKKWMPENIHRYSNYYGYYLDDQKCNKGDVGAEERVITKSQYEEGRHEGFNWVESKEGSNYGKVIKDLTFGYYVYKYYPVGGGIEWYADPAKTIPTTVPSGVDVILTGERYNSHGEPSDSGSTYQCFVDTSVTETIDGRYVKMYYLSDSAKKYNDNSVSSGFLLACIGQQNGKYSLGYENIDLFSILDWYNSTRNLTDGSTDDNNELIYINFSANGYVTKSTKIEDLLKKLTVAGRAIYTHDDSTGKVKVIMDKPVSYPEGIINQQNCISQGNSFNYEELPAGLRISFNDENDGYEENSVYVWADGNSEASYKGQIDPYSIEFVTNPRQLWSLGRYFLACTLQGKEVITAKIGREGKIYELGAVVLVQSDELLIGGGSGRVQELIEEDGTIYGFISDSTYEYTGELDDDDNIKQGVSVFQPKKYGESRTVTLRLHTPTTITVSGKNYTLAVGITNVVLFETPVSRDLTEDTSSTITVKYDFTTGDICMFGEYTKITSKYRVIKRKPEKDGNYTLTLNQYDESLYNYGAKLPNFVPSMTIPPTELDLTTLPDVPTTLKEFATTQEFILTRMDDIYSNYVVNLYKKTTEQITTTGITDSVIYNFSNGQKSWKGIDGATSNGWYFTYEEAELHGSGDMYMTAGTALGKGVEDEIEGSEFANPIPFGQNGTNGYNTATILLYKRNAVQPTELPATLTYHFTDGTITGALNGWSQSIPEVDENKNPVWEIHATALSLSLTDDIEPEEFGTPIKVLQDGYSKSEIMSWIEDTTLETPNVTSELNAIAFSVNRDGIVPIQQTAAIPINVVQNNENLDFSIGTLDLPEGMTATRDGNTLIITVSAGTVLTNGNIKIPVIYTKYDSFDVLVNDENLIWDTENERWQSTDPDNVNPLVFVTEQDNNYYGEIDSVADLPEDPSIDEYFCWSGIDTASTEEVVEGGVFKEGAYYKYNNKWIECSTVPFGEDTQATSSQTFYLPFSWVVVTGDRYIGPYNNIAQIPESTAIDNYFCWLGDNQTQFIHSATGTLLKGALYKWTGYIWEKDEDITHVASAMQDELSVAEEFINANNPDVATYIENLTANTAFVRRLVVTEDALINALATAELVIGQNATTGGYIKSWNYSNNSGFMLDAKTGQLIASGAIIRGDIIANSLTIADGAINQSKINGLTDDLNYLENNKASQTQAQGYANQAQQTAIETAALDATRKADDAESNAVSIAALDATAKADGAKNAATEYTDVQVSTKADIDNDASQTNVIAIKSSNWDNPSSTTGFGIYKNGDAYFNNGTFRGNVKVLSLEIERDITLGNVTFRTNGSFSLFDENNNVSITDIAYSPDRFIRSRCNNNIAIGNDTLSGAYDSNDNIFIGDHTNGYPRSFCSNNIAIGSYAMNWANGNDNIILGKWSGPDGNDTAGGMLYNNIVIGNNSYNKDLILTSIGITANNSSSNNVCIGHETNIPLGYLANIININNRIIYLEFDSTAVKSGIYKALMCYLRNENHNVGALGILGNDEITRIEKDNNNIHLINNNNNNLLTITENNSDKINNDLRVAFIATNGTTENHSTSS